MPRSGAPRRVRSRRRARSTRISTHDRCRVARRKQNTMAVITYREALRQAMREEMERDASVFVIGEEVAEYQGTFRVTEGLLEQFGPLRCVDTPISEEGFTGLAVGAAMMGLRPIVEYMTWNFGIRAMDQIVNH